MRFFIVCLLLLFSGALAQENDTSGIQFDFQTGLAKFSMDGKFDNGDFGFGVLYKTPKSVVEPGLFLTANVDLNTKSNDDVFHTGVMLQAQIMGVFAVGLYYDFWETNIGIKKWYRNNTGFMFLYNFDF